MSLSVLLVLVPTRFFLLLQKLRPGLSSGRRLKGAHPVLTADTQKFSLSGSDLS